MHLPRLCVLGLLAVVFAGRHEAGEAPGRAKKAKVTYGDSRESREWITLPGGTGVAVDEGIEGHGVKAYLSLTGDLVVVDAKTAKVRFHRGGCFVWKTLAFARHEGETVIELSDPHDGGNYVKRFGLDGTEIRQKQANLGKPVALLDHWTGDWCGIASRSAFVVSAAENWRAFWTKFAGAGQSLPETRAGRPSVALDPAAPEIDFSKALAVVVLGGDRSNSSGFTRYGVWEDAERMLLRVRDNSYQTGGRFGGAVRVRPYGLFVVPRTGKKIVVEMNVQRYIAGPPRWKAILDVKTPPVKSELKPLFDAERKLENRLKAMKPSLPEGFVREVKHHSDPKPKEGEEEDPWRSFQGYSEFDYYLDAKGRKVLHGLRRTYSIYGDREIDEIVAEYKDGKVHGRYELHETGGGYIEKECRYENGLLHGRVVERARSRQVDEPGKATRFVGGGELSREATYRRGRLHGEERRYHLNGKPSSVRTWAKGRRDGPAKSFYENGQPKLVGAWRGGRKHGVFVRYAEDGTEIGRYEMADGTGAEIEWYDLGRRRRVTPYVAGRAHGKETVRDESGAKTAEKSYEKGDLRLKRRFAKTGRLLSETGRRRGNLHGRCRAWSDEGKLLRDGTYNFGLPWEGVCAFRDRKDWKQYVSAFKAGTEVGPRSEMDASPRGSERVLPVLWSREP